MSRVNEDDGEKSEPSCCFAPSVSKITEIDFLLCFFCSRAAPVVAKYGEEGRFFDLSVSVHMQLRVL